MTKATKTKHAVTWLAAATMTGGVIGFEVEAASVPKPTVTADPIVVKVEVTHKPAPTKITKTVTKSQNSSSTTHGTSGGSK